MELTVRNLTKRYKDKKAVDGGSLCLTEGINLMMSEGKIILNEPWDKSRTDLEQLYMEEFGGDGE